MHSRGFSHAPSSTWYKQSDFITWDYGSRDNHITFYIDGDMNQGFNEKSDGKKKFLWGLESPKYNDDFISRVKNNLNEVLDTFEMIFTYSDELLSLDSKFKFCPANGFWVDEAKLHEKNKLVSMICSDKQKTEQQRFRVEFANSNKDKVDVMGHLCRGIQKKEEGLNDYMFSVCIENDTHDTYFTEKVLDAFATGTIPIYKGTRNIVNHFNPQGILFLDDVEIDDLTEDLYFSKLEYVKENLEIVKGLDVLENWMYNKYLKDVL
jgi:hypothetical protein